MPRTERQIAEYVEYFRTAPKEERQWALERIAEQEHKSPAEIREICEKYKLLNLRKGVPAPDDLKDKIGEKILSGMSTPEIREIYGVSENLVLRVRQELRDKGKKIPENRGGSKKQEEERQPEAYPGQIEDDPMIEEDVKVFLPNDNVQKQSIAGECRSVWFALRDQLVDFLLGTFGTGTELISEAVETGRERTVATVRTADGKMIKCTLRAEDNDA